MSCESGPMFVRAWRALLVAHAKTVDRIDRDMVSQGLQPSAAFEVLVELDQAGDKRLRMSELASRVVLSRSGLTRQVDRLERDGLIRRERCPKDRRGSHAVLTETGQQAVEQSWPIYAKGIEQHFGRYLSACDQEALLRMLALMSVE